MEDEKVEKKRSHWLAWWPLWLALVCLTVVAVAIMLGDWAGRQRWKRAEAMLAKEGLSLDIKEIGPRAVPDEQNFCAIPALNGLGDGQKGESLKAVLELFDLTKLGSEGLVSPPLEGALLGQPVDWKKVLNAKEGTNSASIDAIAELLQLQEPMMREFLAAVDRPSSRWLPAWQEREFPRLLCAMPIPYATSGLHLFKALRLHALIAAERGEMDRAFACIRIQLRLIEATLAEPTVLGLLVATSGFQYCADTIWQLSYLRIGDADHWATLEKEIGSFDFWKANDRAVHGELVVALSSIKEVSLARAAVSSAIYFPEGESELVMLEILPPGYFDANRATLAEWFVKYRIKPLKSGFWREAATADAELKQLVMRIDEHRFPQPSSVLARSFAGANEDPHLLNHTQLLHRLSLIACSLEKHFSHHQSYPDDLKSITPSQPPLDLWSGESLQYTLTKTGRYKLWSTGPDQTNDGGVRNLDTSRPQRTRFHKPDYKGDVVWDYPAE